MEYHEYKKRFEEAGIKGEYLLSNNEFLTLLNEYESSLEDIIFTDISQVSQEMYEVLRTRLVR